MKMFATVLTVAASILFLSNCTSMPNPSPPYEEMRDRVTSGNAQNLYACRSYNYDPRYCH